VGSKAEAHRGALKLNYPIDHGVVTNWADMERLWAHVYAKDNLNCPSEEHAVSIVFSISTSLSSLSHGFITSMAYSYYYSF
jgi:actin-related protein